MSFGGEAEFSAHGLHASAETFAHFFFGFGLNEVVFFHCGPHSAAEVLHGSGMLVAPDFYFAAEYVSVEFSHGFDQVIRSFDSETFEMLNFVSFHSSFEFLNSGFSAYFVQETHDGYELGGQYA